MSAIEPVQIVLDKPREMMLTLGALRKAEREINKARGLTGKERESIFEIINVEMKKISEAAENLQNVRIDIDFITIMLWASLLREEPGLTLEQVDDMGISPVLVMRKIMECVQETFMKSESTGEEGESNARPLAQQNGSTSGHSPESSSD